MMLKKAVIGKNTRLLNRPSYLSGSTYEHRLLQYQKPYYGSRQQFSSHSWNSYSLGSKICTIL